MSTSRIHISLKLWELEVITNSTIDLFPFATSHSRQREVYSILLLKSLQYYKLIVSPPGARSVTLRTTIYRLASYYFAIGNLFWVLLVVGTSISSCCSAAKISSSLKEYYSENETHAVCSPCTLGISFSYGDSNWTQFLTVLALWWTFYVLSITTDKLL